MQGLRSAQEDRHVAVRIELGHADGWLLAVMDGHNGDQTAELCAQRLPLLVTELLSGPPVATGVEALDIAVRRLEQDTRRMTAGSSLTAAWVPDDADEVAVCVLGDSPVYVRDSAGTVVEGPIHNAATHTDDRARALGRGAVYRSGYLIDPDTMEGIQLTRALGDAQLEFLERTSETFPVSTGPGSFVLIASDGLFAARPTLQAEPDQVGELVDACADAEELLAMIGAAHAPDNVTAVLWTAVRG